MTYPVDNEVVTFDYNNDMQLTSVDGDSIYVSSIAYDSAGRMISRVLGNNKITSTFTYYAWNAANGAGRLQSAVHTNSTTTLQNFAYSYDSIGNILGISDSLTGENQNFGYDALDRLTSASAANGLGDYSESYAYHAATGDLQTKGDLTLQYLDSNHKHAVTNAGGNTYQYDQNGNQTTRIIGSDTYALSYDAENRLIEVRKNSAVIAQFTFDGDGKRIKSVIGSETIYFVGGHYEKQGSNATKYYFAGSQRVAMRKNGTLSFIVSDHLGSTSITTNANGIKASETRYKAFGEVRYTDGVVPTKYSYTGQYSNVADFGLLFYNARWVDPVAGRFTQADSIIAGGLQGYDRYAYSKNNPVRFVDPSGHKACDGEGVDGECDQSGIPGTMGQVRAALNSYGVKLKSRGSATWTFDDAYSAYLGVFNVASALAYASGRESVDIFRRVYGPLSFILDTDGSGLWSCSSTGNIICVNAEGRITDRLIAHELGHEFRRRLLSRDVDLYAVLGSTTISDVNGDYVSGVRNGAWDRTFNGYMGTGAPYVYHGSDDFDDWNSPGEDFADMFMNWVYDSFSVDLAGEARYDWMDDNMTTNWMPLIP